MKYRNHYCSPKYSDGDKCYYGNVEGFPQIPTIEVASIDDFERLFHQAVDDYVVCSVGKYSYDGKDQVVSVGAFGHVFTIPKEKLKQAINELDF